MVHGAFGFLKDENTSRNDRYVYIIRLTEQGVPMFDHREDAMAEMPSSFLVGSVSGKFLHSMLSLMKEVCIAKRKYYSTLHNRCGCNNFQKGVCRPKFTRRFTEKHSQDALFCYSHENGIRHEKMFLFL